MTGESTCTDVTSGSAGAPSGLNGPTLRRRFPAAQQSDPTTGAATHLRLNAPLRSGRRAPGGSAGRGAPGRCSEIKRREAVYGYLFISPWILGFLAFTLLPIVLAIYYSFTDYSLLQSPASVGFDNYRQLWNDPVFWKTSSLT